MKRVHLFEIEDQPWCPPFFRNALTDFLRFAIEVGNQYRQVAPLLRNLLAETGSRTIIDLCSGAGGPWARLLPSLEQDGETKIVLTDKFPNRQAFTRGAGRSAGVVSFVPESVDATNVPAELQGLRTIFTGFHHFDPSGARDILGDAVRKRQPIAIFEATERSLPAIVGMLVSPLLVLLLTPFIRPFRPARLLFTYLLPLIPIMVMWDGVVSCLRTYSQLEMLALTEEADPGRSFEWRFGQLQGRGPVPVSYLIGLPRK